MMLSIYRKIFWSSSKRKDVKLKAKIEAYDNQRKREREEREDADLLSYWHEKHPKSSDSSRLSTSSTRSWADTIEEIIFYEPPAAPEEKELRSFPGGKEITNRSTPQWNWRQPSCRLWIYLVLLKKCEQVPATAYSFARKFDGFGTVLYQRSCEDWKEFLDGHHDADNDAAIIYTILLAMGHKKGATPFDMPYHQLEDDEVEVNEGEGRHIG